MLLLWAFKGRCWYSKTVTGLLWPIGVTYVELKQWCSLLGWKVKLFASMPVCILVYWECLCCVIGRVQLGSAAWWMVCFRSNIWPEGGEMSVKITPQGRKKLSARRLGGDRKLWARGHWGKWRKGKRWTKWPTLSYMASGRDRRNIVNETRFSLHKRCINKMPH